MIITTYMHNGLHDGLPGMGLHLLKSNQTTWRLTRVDNMSLVNLKITGGACMFVVVNCEV